MVGKSSFTTGAGALLLSQPYDPLNLVEDLPNSNMYQTALVWEDGADTGGSPILDYRITYSEENGPE